MDLNLLKQHHVLLESVSGSRAYGLDLPHSDLDIKGVYILNRNDYFGLSYTGQVSNEKNDIIFYELKRFFELLLKNNPNIIDLLGVPDDCIIYKDPLMNRVKPEIFLSRLCEITYGEYAIAQVKKAKGLNKKIVNPVMKERKTVLDFCYVVFGQGAIPIKSWLGEKGFEQECCGLVNIPHMRDLYTIYYDPDGRLYKGIVSGEYANDVSLSSVSKDAVPAGIMSFNKDGYSLYCKNYKEYWNWVNARNEDRYKNTISHGKNYDAKNMMHVFRLLNMAEEIALYKKVVVRRPDREFLLRIRAGEFEYEDLLNMAEEKIEKIKEVYRRSDLQEKPDEVKAEELLIAMREEVYRRPGKQNGER